MLILNIFINFLFEISIILRSFIPFNLLLEDILDYSFLKISLKAISSSEIEPNQVNPANLIVQRSDIILLLLILLFQKYYSNLK